MADEHLQQAAALLQEAAETMILPDPTTEYDVRREWALQEQRDKRQEALVHAVLHVGERLGELLTHLRAEDQR